MASGQGSHWLIESPKVFHLCVTCPTKIFVKIAFKNIHADSIYTIVREFFHLVSSVRMDTLLYPIYTHPFLMLPRVL